ncbi:hypothetical protein HZH66_010383 [Vespula vulgaris]|uniref:C2H2-type domain-containing protein n=1 Tax=Vespula vulgaris TaxID=7454 RepID=A0A834JKM3_VESVU|nr:hypothetical protein HZH66_010383 [Vespula vulgaris]
MPKATEKKINQPTESILNSSSNSIARFPTTIFRLSHHRRKHHRIDLKSFLDRAGVTKGGTDVSPSCKHHRINTDLVVLDDDCGDVGGVGVGVGSRSTEAEFLFRCRICWKGFKHPMSLTLHKDLHAGQTKCPICQRIFSRSYDMKAHLMRIHANAKVDFRH